MARRTLLTTLCAAGTVGLAGCGDGVESALSTPIPEGAQRPVTLEAQDGVPPEYAVSIHAEIPEPTVTHEHPVALQITTTNECPAERHWGHGPTVEKLGFIGVRIPRPIATRWLRTLTAPR